MEPPTSKIEQIKAYWDARAKEYGADFRATLKEEPLRRLEIETMVRYIKKLRPRIVLDFGCGNGYSTLEYARRFPDIRFVGIDYSEEMIRLAQQNQTSNCQFKLGDVLRPETLPNESADLILTQRCLQNLPDYPSQKAAIVNLRSKLMTGGTLLLMECSKDGVAQVNRFRKYFFREPLKNPEPWYNAFFIDRNLIEDFSAEIDYFCSTYMFFSRVASPILFGLTRLLPNLGRFGYERLYIIQREAGSFGEH